MSNHHTAELPIMLTNNEVSFVIEFCGDDLEIDTKLKLEFARTQKDSDATVLLTSTELRYLSDLLLTKAEQAPGEAREWAEEITTWIAEQAYKKREVLH